jgi:ribosomal protein L29
MKGNLENLNKEELEKKKRELKEEIRKIRFNLAIAGSTSNTKRIRDAKKEIARIFTIQRQNVLKDKAGK